MDESNASERLGVPPSQVADYLALVGDTSDNVPGVKGIGEKGAQKLLADYGDLETILSSAADVTAKRTREALLAQADSARLSRELVTIHRDVPVAVELDALRAGDPDYPSLVRIATELEFASLARKFAQAGQGAGAAVAATGDDGAGRESAIRALRAVPGLRFAKVLGTADGATFSARGTDLRHWALVTAWDSPELADDFAEFLTLDAYRLLD